MFIPRQIQQCPTAPLLCAGGALQTSTCHSTLRLCCSELKSLRQSCGLQSPTSLTSTPTTRFPTSHAIHTFKLRQTFVLTWIANAPRTFVPYVRATNARVTSRRLLHLNSSVYICWTHPVPRQTHCLAPHSPPSPSLPTHIAYNPLRANVTTMVPSPTSKCASTASTRSLRHVCRTRRSWHLTQVGVEKLAVTSTQNHRAGAIPSGPTCDTQLVPLTAIEQNLVSLNRVYRNIYILKPNSWTWGNDGTRQWGQRAHVLAVPNAGTDKVRDCLLQPLDALPNTIQVIFLTVVDMDDPVRRGEAIRAMVDRAPALKVRGREVVKWAYHLSRVRLQTIV